MTREVRNGTPRKRAMIMRESQNRPFRNAGSDRPQSEYAELEKGRMKRECHRADEASLSPEIPLLRNSVTMRRSQSRIHSAAGFAKLHSPDSERDRPHMVSHVQRATHVAVSPQPVPSFDHSVQLTNQITPSLFMKQKLRLELVERALAVCSEEKQQLQKQLQASLQTAFKLQEVIMKQKMVLELEQVAARQRSQKNEQILIERDELKRKLDVAIRLKEEAELTLSLSRDLNVRLFPGTEFADAFQECDVQTGSLVTSDVTVEVRRQSNDKQMELLRQELDETRVEAMIHQAVAECVYTGALRASEAERVEEKQSIMAQTAELKRRLEEAVRLKEEAQLTVSLSRDLNSRLFPGTGKRSKTYEGFVAEEAYVLRHEDKLSLIQGQASDEQLTVLRQELDLTRVEAAVYEAVIESVYTGALVACEAKRLEAREESNNLAKKVEDLKGQISILQEKLNSCDETVELPNFRPIPQYEQDSIVPSEDTTPLKVKSSEPPFKFFLSKRVTSIVAPVDQQYCSPWMTRSTTLDLCIAAQREAALTANLRKSVKEMEFLGNKVEEHKSILEKVTLLLSFISNSGYSANGSKQLAREICDQLEQYDGEFR